MIKLLFLLPLIAPMAPKMCLEFPVWDSFQCPNDDTHYYVMERVGCEEPKLVFHACGLVEPVDPDVRPEPLKCNDPKADQEFCIDPEYDPNVPPGPGPPGAGPVDKPD